MIDSRTVNVVHKQKVLSLLLQSQVHPVTVLAKNMPTECHANNTLVAVKQILDQSQMTMCNMKGAVRSDKTYRELEKTVFHSFLQLLVLVF